MLTSTKALIVAPRIDSVNIGPTALQLIDKGFGVTVFEVDSIIRGTRSFSAKVDQSGGLRLEYDGRLFEPGSYDVAWFRRGDMYHSLIHKDRYRWLSFRDEHKTITDTVVSLVRPGAWLNDPAKMHVASLKLRQLQDAARIGFRIPETLTTNTWALIDALPHKKLIVKMAQPTLVPSESGRKFMPTTVIDKKTVTRKVLPYPGIWQPYVAKKREWRVTVVGDKVFGAAIYTSDQARDDWRKHQFTPEVSFVAEDFPADQAQLCKDLLAYYGLRFGAFDFIETEAGEMIFLEVNLNGQFMWLEEELGLPISAAIADELATVAAQSND